MSKHIMTHKPRSDETQPSDANFDCFFPFFVFALRDFALIMSINGKPVTNEQYMEHCLQLKDGDDERSKKSNEPRLCIRKYFRKRFCFTFDRPGSKTALQELERVPDEKLSEDFVKDMTEFVNFVYRKAPVKQLENGQNINGRSRC